MRPRTNSKMLGELVQDGIADIQLIAENKKLIPFYEDGKFVEDADITDAKLIGSGQQGKVYAVLVTVREDGQDTKRLCALKEIHGKTQNSEAFSKHLDTTKTHNTSTQNNVIKLMAVLNNNGDQYALMPYSGLFLDKLITELPRLNDESTALKETIILHVLMDALSALQSMHQDGIVHGDIKSANIAYYLGHFCLIDLDCALKMGEEVKKISGSPLFMHPGCFSDRNFCARPENDIYGLGIVLKQLLQDQETIDLIQHPKREDVFRKEQDEKWGNALLNRKDTKEPEDLETKINSKRSIHAKLLEIANRMIDIRVYGDAPPEQKTYQPSIAELLSCCETIKQALLENHSDFGSLESQEQELRKLYESYIPREFLSLLPSDVESPIASKHVSRASFFSDPLSGTPKSSTGSTSTTSLHSPNKTN